MTRRPFGEPLLAAGASSTGPDPTASPVDASDASGAFDGASEEEEARRPLLVRLLRLRHLHPAGWQRVLLGDVPLALALLLVLADLASAWLLLALPAAVAVMVVLHDVVAGRVARDAAGPPD